MLIGLDADEATRIVSERVITRYSHLHTRAHLPTHTASAPGKIPRLRSLRTERSSDAPKAKKGPALFVEEQDIHIQGEGSLDLMVARLVPRKRG